MRIFNQKADFTAKWDEENRDLGCKSLIDRIGRCVLYSLLKPFLYPGASFTRWFTTDWTRQKRGYAALEKIGGKRVNLQTPDGDQISGTMLKAADFKQEMSRYFELKEGYWTLRNEFYIQEGLGTRPSDEGFQKIKEVTENWHIPLEVKKTFVDGKLKAEPRFYIGGVSSKKSAVILTHGNAMNSVSYKGYAFFYLMRGIDVFLVDHRGFGKSSGSPSDKKCKLDLDTVYQYLRDKEGIPNHRLMVHGHCMGSAVATDLAARRKGVHIILDRPIAETKKRMIRFMPISRPLVEYFTPKYLNYDNRVTLPKVKGKIICLYSTIDHLVSFEETSSLIEAFPDNSGQLIPITTVGHEKSWTQDRLATNGIDLFLKNSLRRKL